MIEHPETERVDPIAGDVRAVWRDSRERYGARKIKAALERRGVTASRRRIGNIMREQGMTSAYARRRFKPHRTRVNEARLANLLDRECVCSIESGPCERVESLQMSGRF